MNIITPLNLPWVLALSLILPASAQIEVDVNGFSQQWTSSQGTTAGFPQQVGTPGVVPATVDLSGGLSLTVSQSIHGAVTPVPYSGYIEGEGEWGNLARNIDRRDYFLPEDPEQVGFSLSAMRTATMDEGAPGTLSNYMRYDFVFNQAVQLGDVVLTDIDALQGLFHFPGGDTPYRGFADGVMVEAWASMPGAVGTGEVGVALAPGGMLSTGSLGGLPYAYQAESPTPDVGDDWGHHVWGPGASDNPEHFATFSAAGPVQAFSIYIFNTLTNPDEPYSTVEVGLRNFSVTPIPEPGVALLGGIALLGLSGRRRGA